MIKTLFTSQDTVLPVFFPGLLYRILSEDGIDDSSLFLGTTLSKESFSNEDLRISFNEHKQFISNALMATRDPNLGMRFGKHINVTALGMLGYAAMSCQTLESSLETITHYFKIRAPLYELTLLREANNKGESAIQIDESLNFGEMRYFLLSSALSGTAHLLAYYSNDAHIIRHAELSCPQPKSWEKIQDKIDYPIAFNKPHTRIFFPSSHLDQAMRMSDPQTEKSTKQICEQLLSRIENQSGIVGQVREYILAHAGQYPSLETAAEHFCVSPRTFRRKLQQSDTTYQNILNKVRETIALEYLNTTNKPIYEIAIELGFNDLSNFGRAFKRWTNKPPSAYRK